MKDWAMKCLESFIWDYFKNEEQLVAGFFTLHKDYSLLIDIQDFETQSGI
jgi:hypothetical protein